MTPADKAAPRAEIHREFNAFWRAIESIGMVEGIDEKVARDIYFLGWRACEKQRDKSEVTNGSD